MNSSQLHQEIRNINVMFMRLAQQMLQADKSAATAALGVSDELADLVSGMSGGHIDKMATSSMLLCNLHFDDNVLLNLVGQYTQAAPLQVEAPKQLVAA